MKKISVLLLSILLCACGSDDNYTPKPRGYFRIALPEKEYTKYQPEDCSYSFDLNKVAKVASKKECWADVIYPKFKATIQLTYKPVNEHNLDTLLKEGQDLAYEHIVKADGIQEKLFVNPEKKVFGQFYSIAGDAATSTQFYVTDSTSHFLRGVLYFYATPNADSIKPVNDFMQDEIVTMIESLRWQN